MTSKQTELLNNIDAYLEAEADILTGTHTMKKSQKKHKEYKDHVGKGGAKLTQLRRKIPNPYFPNILDPDFNVKLAQHEFFRRYTQPTNEEKIKQLYEENETNRQMHENETNPTYGTFLLTPSQKFLKTFISPYSPFRGLFVIHGTGVGKTCTAISIAEQLKSEGRKIIVIRPDEIERSIFEIQTVRDGLPDKQCTTDTYVADKNLRQYVTGCMSGNADACDQLESKVSKTVKKYYIFNGAQKWANDVKLEIEQQTKNLVGSEKDAKIKRLISRKFDNAVIIIDEAHQLRNTTKGQDKVVPPVLNMVLRLANNIRLIMLSATPIFDVPDNIVSLLNFF